MSNTFFTSDTHFGHKNIIKYCNRPFKDTKEMDEALIDNWNSKVKKGDYVFHLGDFSLSNGNAGGYLNQLNGYIRFIRGNHDKDAEDLQRNVTRAGKLPPFLSFDDVRMVSIDGQQIWLSHYAHRVWPKSHRGVWHLYGHSHGTLPDDPNSLSFDCGVDCHNYAPLSFDEVKALMAKKTFKAIDHHGKDEATKTQ